MGLRDQAYSTIFQWIMSARLPRGSVTSEVELSSMLDMSRTPVRAALQQLETEGYVRIVPKHGVIILDTSAQRVSDLIEVIASLVCYAIAHSRHVGQDEMASSAADLWASAAYLLYKGEEIEASDLQTQEKTTFKVEALIAFEYQMLERIISICNNKEMDHTFKMTTTKLFWFQNKRRWHPPYHYETVECLEQFISRLTKRQAESLDTMDTLFAYFHILKKTWV
ncbi:GntR family transcriptional regulator [Paenibacillus eucommiae]|uniref:DNA-binding GntR family transcriptional regulator n=1 Tax=Paenibacillus eucommiae TaxID=1355755 RepID=A0ABS4ILJ0_9BACL|nr:GntR family transcriptional regulator [Paenibacillus eucommiae]MBP1988434.1 DNA-binding GntR family transcriptional regulator [Paenibacillus eucommiae]